MWREIRWKKKYLLSCRSRLSSLSSSSSWETKGHLTTHPSEILQPCRIAMHFYLCTRSHALSLSTYQLIMSFLSFLSLLVPPQVRTLCCVHLCFTSSVHTNLFPHRRWCTTHTIHNRAKCGIGSACKYGGLVLSQVHRNIMHANEAEVMSSYDTKKCNFYFPHDYPPLSGKASIWLVFLVWPWCVVSIADNNSNNTCCFHAFP